MSCAGLMEDKESPKIFTLKEIIRIIMFAVEKVNKKNKKKNKPTVIFIFIFSYQNLLLLSFLHSVLSSSSFNFPLPSFLFIFLVEMSSSSSSSALKLVSQLRVLCADESNRAAIIKDHGTLPALVLFLDNNDTQGAHSLIHSFSHPSLLSHSLQDRSSGKNFFLFFLLQNVTVFGFSSKFFLPLFMLQL